MVFIYLEHKQDICTCTVSYIPDVGAVTVSDLYYTYLCLKLSKLYFPVVKLSYEFVSVACSSPKLLLWLSSLFLSLFGRWSFQFLMIKRDHIV
jgi:hypothetical protein